MCCRRSGAVVGEHGVDGIGNGGSRGAQKKQRRCGAWRVHAVGHRRIAGLINGHEEIELTLLGAHLGDIDMEVSNEMLLELLPGWLVSLDIGQAADAMRLETAVQGRTGQARHGGLEGVETVVQRLPAKGSRHRFLFLGQDRGAGLRPHPRIFHRSSFRHLATVFGLIPYCLAKRFKLT